jgi:hypothetical protein
MNRKVVLALSLGLIAVSLGANPATSAAGQSQHKLSGLGYPEDDIFVWQRLKLGLERPNTRFCMVVTGTAGAPIQAFEEFGICERGRVWLAKSLNDLRGRIQIKSEADALKFVRLLTAPDTSFLWKQGQEDMEVLDEKDRESVPNFGVKKPWFKYVTRADGTLGVLKHEVFVAGGYSRPTVKALKHGYQITRWIHSKFYLGDHPKEVTRLVSEFVGRDGRFNRTVVKTRKEPAPVSFMMYE